MTPARADDGIDVTPDDDLGTLLDDVIDDPTGPQPRRRPPWMFAVLGVLLGLAISWGVWSLGNDAPQQMPSDHPATAGSTAVTPEPLTPEQMAELKATVDANPQSLDDRLVYGVALYNEALYPEAEEQWLAASGIAPADPGPWYNLGFLYLSTDPPQDTKAEEAWRKVVELSPDSSMARTVQQYLDRLDTVPPDLALPAPTPTPTP